MTLNIKNPQACRLINELAALTGETMTGAVTIAVRERIDRVRRRGRAGIAARLLALGRDCAERLGPEYRSADHDSLFYDEVGLPR
jgi:antitoxin VapB